MAYRQTTLKNLRTGKEYPVSDEGLERIKKNGWMSRYTIVDQRVVNDATPKSSFLPAEISESSKAAAAALGSEVKPNAGPSASR